MKNLSRIGKLSLGLVVGAVMIFGAKSISLAAPPCYCPDVYAPVICSNGKVYSNACRASCAHATGCRPYGDV
jgi:hypothetical protein